MPETTMGMFTMGEKTPKAEPFHCDNCGKDKKSKNVGKLKKKDGSMMTLCNGCYGELLDKSRTAATA
jgi:hypothetical protein